MSHLILLVGLPGRIRSVYNFLSLLNWRRVILELSGLLALMILWPQLIMSLASLRALNPPPYSCTSLSPLDSAMTPITLSPSQVSRAVMSFSAGSAGGPDGLHPQHLKDLLHPPSDSNYIRTIELYFFYRFIHFLLYIGQY